MKENNGNKFKLVIFIILIISFAFLSYFRFQKMPSAESGIEDEIYRLAERYISALEAADIEMLSSFFENDHGFEEYAKELSGMLYPYLSKEKLNIRVSRKEIKEDSGLYHMLFDISFREYSRAIESSEALFEKVMKEKDDKALSKEERVKLYLSILKEEINLLRDEKSISSELLITPLENGFECNFDENLFVILSGNLYGDFEKSMEKLSLFWGEYIEDDEKNESLEKDSLKDEKEKENSKTDTGSSQTDSSNESSGSSTASTTENHELPKYDCHSEKDMFGKEYFICHGCFNAFESISSLNAHSCRGYEEEKHIHSWEGIYSDIWIDAAGHFEYGIIEESFDEPIYEIKALCKVCGEYFDTGDEAGRHNIEAHSNEGSYSSASLVTGYIHHEAVYGDVFVIDQEGYWTKVLSYERCKECGEIRP